MRILISTLGSGGIHVMKLGIAKAFASCGHQVRLWQYSGGESPLDVVHEFQPEIWIGNGYSGGGLTRAARKAIKISGAKVILYTPAAIDSLAAKVKRENPHLIFDVASQEDVAAIDDVSPYIEGVWIHHHPNVSNIYLDGWQHHCKKYFGVGMAYDALTYEGGRFREELKSDVSMIGGAWGWKLEKMKPWIYPLLNDKKLNTKLFGQGWSVVQGLGPLPEHLASSLWKSTTVNIALNEPQAGFPCGNSELPEQNERPFKVIPNGFLISDHTDVLANHYFGRDEIVTASNPQDFHDKIYHFLKNPDERIPYMQKGRNRIWNSHTYFHRVSEIFDHLGMREESIKVINKYEEFRKTI